MTNETENVRSGRPDDFEAVIEAADNSTVVFIDENRSPLRAIQHFLHVYPTTIPFLVLVLGVTAFAYITGNRFFHPFNLSLVLQQVTIIALVGIAQTLVILT